MEKGVQWEWMVHQKVVETGLDPVQERKHFLLDKTVREMIEPPQASTRSPSYKICAPYFCPQVYAHTPQYHTQQRKSLVELTKHVNTAPWP